MQSQIRKILYATDLSPNSAHAFRYALKLAMDNGARIVILHVVDNTLLYHPMAIGGIIPEEKLNELVSHFKLPIGNRVQMREILKLCSRTS